MASVMLTTIDNPYNPFKDFENWYRYDELHGYSTCGLLARITTMNENALMTDTEEKELIENSIDQIIEMNNKLYKKVFEKDSFENKNFDSKSEKESKDTTKVLK